MHRRVIASGLLGGVVLLVWTAVWFGLVPFHHDATAREIPDEDVVFDVISERIGETGIYSYPYDVPADSAFHERFEAGPILQILFQKEGGAAPSETVRFLSVVLAYLLVPIIPAWALSVASHERTGRYIQRVWLVMLFGIFVAVFRDLTPTGIMVPSEFSLVVAVHSVVGWGLVGIILAWRISPELGRAPRG
jgi:hypothetical protein